MHVLLGTPKYLKIDRDKWGPIPVFDLFRAHASTGEQRVDRSRLITLHQHQMQQLTAAMEKGFDLLGDDNIG